MMRTKFLAVLAAALSFVRITVGVVIGITGIVIVAVGAIPLWVGGVLCSDSKDVRHA